MIDLSNHPFDAVVIGASAGGVEAFMTILPSIPRENARPIVSVIHIPRNQKSLLPELFQRSCSLVVKEVEDKEPLCDGTIYFAPPNYHVLIESKKMLSLSNEEPVQFSRPSIDVLFESAADVFHERLVGIVLTGANSDGANGLGRICQAGGVGIVQDPATALSQEMPRSALAVCPRAHVMHLKEIANFLRSAFAEASS